jgi:tRNA A-37 threonylcarbamoyl transferase component Bud32
MMFRILIVVVVVMPNQLVVHAGKRARAVLRREMSDGEQPPEQDKRRDESWAGFHRLQCSHTVLAKATVCFGAVQPDRLSALAACFRAASVAQMASLLASARSWVDRIHLNWSVRGERAGRAVLLKRRRVMAWPVMRLANFFFRCARNPVEAIASADGWRRWEEEWFRRLHGPDFRAGTDPDGTLWMEMLPGQSLSDHLVTGTLRPAHLAAAGAELRRAHAVRCAYHGGGFSHGDSHTGNFIFDPATGRARLVDFEVRHLRTLPENERHADDLLVMLQDVCGRCAPDDWLPFAGMFLDGYGREEIVALLLDKLHVPRGIPRVWWAVRTTWMPRAELERRLALLRSRRREEAG